MSPPVPPTPKTSPCAPERWESQNFPPETRTGSAPGLGMTAFVTTTVPPNPTGFRKLKKPRKLATQAPSPRVSPANTPTRMKERRAIFRDSTWRACWIPEVPRDSSTAIDILGVLAVSLLARDAFIRLEAPREDEHLAFTAEPGANDSEHAVGCHPAAKEHNQGVPPGDDPAFSPEGVDE